MSDNHTDLEAQSIELPPEDITFIAENLAGIAEYFGQIDGFWDEDEEGFELEIPNLSSDSAELLRTKVLSSIHRTDVAATTLRLGTEGILQVLLALVRPAMSVGQNRRPRKESSTDV